MIGRAAGCTPCLVALWISAGAVSGRALAAPPQVQEPLPAQPVLRELKVEGATAFGAAEIAEHLRMQVGEALPQAPEDLATDLEKRYEREGYDYARVTAAFDEASGTLTLTVNEARIDAIEFQGIDEQTAKRFAAEFEARPGDIFNRRDLHRALARLLAPTGGAIVENDEPPPGTVFTDTRRLRRHHGRSLALVDRDGKRVLLVRLRTRRGRVHLTAGSDRREDWFNPVDGFAPAIGFSTTVFDPVRLNHTYVEGYFTYKFGREEPGYSFGFERPFLGDRKLFVGAAVHDITDSDDRWRVSSLEQSLVALAFKNTFRDYYRRRGWQLHAAFRPHPTHEVTAAWRDDRHEALANATDYSFFRDSHEFRPNRPIAPGTLRSLVVGYTWDSRGLQQVRARGTYLSHQLDDLYDGGAHQEPGWRIGWTSEIAPEAFGGAFDFRRHIINVRRYTRLSPRQSFNARLLAGVSDGDLPPQRQFALGGIGTVHGHAFKETVGEQMVLVNAEYKLAFAGSPPSPGFGGVVFFDLGRVYNPIDGSREDWLKGIGLGVEFGSDFRIEFGYRLDDVPKSLQVLVRLRPSF